MATRSSSTIEAPPFTLPDYGPTPAVHIDVTQHVPITKMGGCSFPVELQSCVTGVQQGKPLTLTTRGSPPPNVAIAVYLGWWP
jgi:hypothetical protein